VSDLAKAFAVNEQTSRGIRIRNPSKKLADGLFMSRNELPLKDRAKKDRALRINFSQSEDHYDTNLSS